MIVVGHGYRARLQEDEGLDSEVRARSAACCDAHLGFVLKSRAQLRCASPRTSNRDISHKLMIEGHF